jgi:transcriptional regulator with XRE-family HTH domain
MIAKKIKELRKERGWSQIQLAVKIDVYPDYISWWESGKRDPSLINAISLADAFGVSLDELCGRVKGVKTND